MTIPTATEVRIYKVFDLTQFLNRKLLTDHIYAFCVGASFDDIDALKCVVDAMIKINFDEKWLDSNPQSPEFMKVVDEFVRIKLLDRKDDGSLKITELFADLVVKIINLGSWDLARRINEITPSTQVVATHEAEVALGNGGGKGK